LKNIDIHEVSDVRIGKHITLSLEAETEDAAREIVDAACRKLLANLIMETFSFELKSE
jgi:phosphoribosylformylglycinamidine synthase